MKIRFYLPLICAIFLFSQCHLERLIEPDPCQNPPIAEFSVSSDTCGIPCSISFINASENASIFSWDFGNGVQSSLINPPPQSFDEYGTYAVRLIAENKEGCRDTFSRAIHYKRTFMKVFENLVGYTPIYADMPGVNKIRVLTLDNSIVNLIAFDTIGNILPGYPIQVLNQSSFDRFRITKVKKDDAGDLLVFGFIDDYPYHFYFGKLVEQPPIIRIEGINWSISGHPFQVLHGGCKIPDGYLVVGGAVYPDSLSPVNMYAAIIKRDNFNNFQVHSDTVFTNLFFSLGFDAHSNLSGDIQAIYREFNYTQKIVRINDAFETTVVNASEPCFYNCKKTEENRLLFFSPDKYYGDSITIAVTEPNLTNYMIGYPYNITSSLPYSYFEEKDAAISSNNIVLTGRSSLVFSGGDADLFVISMNPTSGIVFQKAIGTPTLYETGVGVIPMSGGDLIIVGSSGNKPLMIRMDNMGNF